MTEKSAVIVGAGAGLSASVVRELAARGYQLTLAARNVDKLEDLTKETGAKAIACDSSDPKQVGDLFGEVQGNIGVVLYNPSYRLRGPIADLDPQDVEKALKITAYGAFLTGQAAARRMLDQESDALGVKGTILFTGASAGVKGFASSAPFAMGKFAQRGLSQSMSRELHPKGIHVCWINVDGGIHSERRPSDPANPNALLEPEAIAREYMRLVDQHPSAWSEELSLRPWVEPF